MNRIIKYFNSKDECVSYLKLITFEKSICFLFGVKNSDGVNEELQHMSFNKKELEQLIIDLNTIKNELD